jgi:hypothetical protein
MKSAAYVFAFQTQLSAEAVGCYTGALRWTALTGLGVLSKVVRYVC